jgi:hypothetical protein
MNIGKAKANEIIHNVGKAYTKLDFFVDLLGH